MMSSLIQIDHHFPYHLIGDVVKLDIHSKLQQCVASRVAIKRDEVSSQKDCLQGGIKHLDLQGTGIV